MYIRDVIDKSQLPRDVHFYTGDDLTFQLQLKNSTVSEKFSTITLKNMYEVTYLQGNSIFHSKYGVQKLFFVEILGSTYGPGPCAPGPYAPGPYGSGPLII